LSKNILIFKLYRSKYFKFQKFYNLPTWKTSFFLEKKDALVEEYLRKQKWIKSTEKVLSLEKPGEGNMNFVLRVKTDQGSFIIKQARPWVEKFPQIPARLKT